MERTLDAGQILLNSLQLLGLSPAVASREYGCTIAADMFVQPNQKGLNTIFHLLFDRVRGRETFRKEIKGAWPVKDSSHQREFNKVIHRMVTDLAQAGHVPKHLAAYLLQGFRQLSGSRLTALLCYIAAYLLTKDPQCSDAHARYPSKELPSKAQALEPLYKSLRAQNGLQRKHFVQMLKDVQDTQTSWNEAAEKLAASYRTSWKKHCEMVGKDTVGAVSAAESAEAAAELRDPSVADSSHDDVMEAADAATRMWTAVEDGVVQQQRLREALADIVTQTRHPHAIDGVALRADHAAAAGPAAGAVALDLPGLLKDWGALVEESQGALLDVTELERLEAQDRPVAPLLAPEHQLQVSSISAQHESRLHSQEQLAAALKDLLAAAVSQREALSWKVNAALGLEQPQVPCPRSPTKDLIPALYPEGNARMLAEGIMSQSSLPNASKTATGANLSKLVAGDKGLLERENIQAQLEQVAYPATAYEDSIRLLQLYIANAPPTILEATGPTTTFATSFTATDAAAGGGVAAAHAEMKRQIELAWQACSSVRSVMKRAPEGLDEPAVSLPPKPAAPRRLSFSDTTPDLAKPVSCADEGSAAAAAPDTSQLSVDELMFRMGRLRGQL